MLTYHLPKPAGCLRGAKPLFSISLPLPWQGRGIKGVGCQIKTSKTMTRNKGANYPLTVSKGSKPFGKIFRGLDFDLRASFLRGPGLG